MTPHRMSTAEWLTLLILSLVWGGSFFFIEVAGPFLPPLLLVWLRVTLAAAALAAVLHATGTPWPRRADWPALFVMGTLNNALPFSLLTMAQTRIDGGVASILNATTPLFTLVVAALAGQDRLTLPRAAGLACGLAGVAALAGPAAPAGQTLAYLACLAAALSYALAGVWGRRFAGRPPLSTAFGMLACAAVLLGPPALLVDRPWTLPVPPAAALAAVAALAILSTAAAYILYFRLLATAGAVNLSLVTFLVPASAIGLGVLVLGETLLARHLAGLALILGGLALVSRRPTRGAV